MKVFEIIDLKKRYGGEEVLKGVSLEVNEGEIVGIIGPSGSGKTTLLRCSVGLERFNEGAIFYDSRLREDQHRVHSIVFQDYQLFPHFTVIENITHPIIKGIKGKNKKEEKERIIESAKKILKKLNLENREEAYPCELSGGQKQRVAIARALAQNPKILFFDEPTAALDPKLVNELAMIIRSLSDGGMAVVIVTHDIKFAETTADRIIEVKEGIIL